MSNGDQPTDMEDGQASPDVGAPAQRPEAQEAGTAYGSNVSGSQVASLAVGDKSRAVTIIHQHGLSFTEAEKLFGLLFEQNFPRLAETARAEARRRVDEFAATFTRVAAAQKVTEEQLGAFAEPDVQFVLTRAIETSARRDCGELRQNLTRLVVHRLRSGGNDLRTLVFGEAVLALQKLTSNQVRIMSLCFAVRHLALNTQPVAWASFNDYLQSYVVPFVDVDRSFVNFQHIVYTGCGVNNAVHMSLEKVLRASYADLFVESVGIERMFAENSSVGVRLLELWTKSGFEALTLTPVGIAIAITTLERTLEHELPVEVWLS